MAHDDCMASRCESEAVDARFQRTKIDYNVDSKSSTLDIDIAKM
jgi:hypothetical protein